MCGGGVEREDTDTERDRHREKERDSERQRVREWSHRRGEIESTITDKIKSPVILIQLVLSSVF